MTNATIASNATTPAELLSETRRARGLTTRQIAPLVGVSFSTVAKWERGIGEPTASQFVLWARATDQAPELMFRGLMEMVRPKGLEPLTFWLGAWGLTCPCSILEAHERGECPYGCSCNRCAPDWDAAFWGIIECQDGVDAGIATPSEVAR